MIKNPYIISLWEDIHVAASGTTPAHYGESKIMDIGSDTMEAQWRAREPKLVRNINGTHTFTFKILYHYIDTQTGEEVDNPLKSLLVNERKLKVYWKKDWYDLVIKNIQEDSSGKTFTYTCSDQYIQELSKNGYNLEFSTDLNNNMGTINELGQTVVDGTDWSIDTTVDPIVQYKTENVYSISSSEFKAGFSAYQLNDNGTTTAVTITTTDTLYLFYSSVESKFHRLDFYKVTGTLKYDDDTGIITEGVTQMFTDDVQYTLNTEIVNNVTKEYIEIIKGSNVIFKLYTDKAVDTTLRAKHRVISQKTHFDSHINRTVYEYLKDGTTYYGYSKTSYRDPTYVANLLANTKDFTGIEGWSDNITNNGIWWKIGYNRTTAMRYGSKLNIPISLIDPESSISATNPKRSNWILNTGIKNNLSYLEDGFQKGQHYIFRIQGYRTRSSAALPIFFIENSNSFEFHIGIYSINTDGTYNIDNQTNYFSKISVSMQGGWLQFELECTNSITKTRIENSNFGFLFRYTDTYNPDPLYYCSTSYYFAIKDIQFYRDINNYLYPADDLYPSNDLYPADHNRLEPGELALFSIQETEYFYYNPNLTTTYTSDGILYEYCSNEDNSSYIPQYDYTCTAIRSITEKGSNRFNLIQKLAETFECYAVFSTQHNSDGSIIYGSKKIKFVENVGQETGLSFVYGIDLKTISRTIQSDQLVTKIIVPQNSNEYAENGFCSIARSKENYSKSNFILNFDYYISHGMLNFDQINNDLYNSDSQYIGYLYHLRDLNGQYDSIAETLTQKQAELVKQNSSYTVYSNYVISAQQELSTLLEDIKVLSGTDNIDDAQEYYSNHSSHTSLKNKIGSYIIIKDSLEAYPDGYLNQLAALESSRTALSTFITNKTAELATLKTQIETLDKTFFKKYARFIQEGTWSSEDYYDDNLYYLDAQSTLYTSSRPQVSYNISVIRLDALEEYKGRSFNVGDIGYVEDTEFFGYASDGTPYKEQILISESTENFDSPELDSFKVQNYKTQYEDLFQRITATTQALQYASGSYGRAATAMNTNGTISNDTLQSSLNESQDLTFATQNNNIIYGNDGLVVKDPLDNSKQVRLSAGGLQITKDGGNNWNSALTPKGISTELLTAGRINTERIELYAENQPAFLWNSKGINAFSTENSSIDKSKFVRMDQYGIYGVQDNDADSFTPTSIDDITDNASFGLTWDGFFLNNKNTTGNVTKSFSISTEEDLVIKETTTGSSEPIIRLKIGNISTDSSNPHYGICIYDSDGNAVLKTDDTGDLRLVGRIYFGNSNNSYIGPPPDNSWSNDYFININDTFTVTSDGTVSAISYEYIDGGRYTPT